MAPLAASQSLPVLPIPALTPGGLRYSGFAGTHSSVEPNRGRTLHRNKAHIEQGALMDDFQVPGLSSGVTVPQIGLLRECPSSLNRRMLCPTLMQESSAFCSRPVPCTCEKVAQAVEAWLGEKCGH